MELSIQKVNLQNAIHATQVIKLLNDYMKDPMGNNSPMAKGIAPQIIAGLKKHSTFLGFFVLADDQYAGLANCNINFSTFQAKPLINIHDFIVAPESRNMGAGSFLLRGIINYASQNDYCRVNLEVREDNLTAKSLYKKMGFSDCVPRMMFWEKKL
ncbi:MAG TPA: GNAT family N-acetyltransferase [Prolixibacteraceae bacterium]|nr:GNAT family N-acetyltransferase [Prolixibacteraceae bacterium]